MVIFHHGDAAEDKGEEVRGRGRKKGAKEGGEGEESTKVSM